MTIVLPVSIFTLHDNDDDEVWQPTVVSVGATTTTTTTTLPGLPELFTADLVGTEIVAIIPLQVRDPFVEESVKVLPSMIGEFF